MKNKSLKALKKPKYSGWHCPYGDMQIMMASQEEVDKHLATHKDKVLKALIEKEFKDAHIYDAEGYVIKDWIKDTVYQIAQKYARQQKNKLLKELRDKLWKLDEEWHKPHDEMKTDCSDGSLALNEFEIVLIDKMESLKNETTT